MEENKQTTNQKGKKTNNQSKAGRKQTKNRPSKSDRKVKTIKQSQKDRKQLMKHSYIGKKTNKQGRQELNKH